VNEDRFFQQIEILAGRVSTLQKNTNAAPELQNYSLVLGELETALEELQVAGEELLGQNEELAIAREKVDAERQRYQDLFEFAPDGYLVTDPNGKIQEANRAATVLLNTGQRFLVGRLLISFTVPEARPIFRDILLQFTRELDPLQEQERVLRLQPSKALRQQRGGLPFDASLKMTAIRDSAGKLVAVRCLVRDITERQQMLEAVIRARVAEAMNQELQKEISERQRLEAEHEELLVQLDHKQRLLEAVLQQMPAGITIAEVASGRIILANEESKRILGHSFMPTDIEQAHPNTGAVHPDGRPYDGEEYPQRRSRLSGEVVKGEEMHYVRGDGTRTVLSVNTAPIYDPEGRIIATVGAFYDIAERKRMEIERDQLLDREQEARHSAETANRLKDEFLSVLSHEIRTPLNAMMGWATLLRSRKFDEATTARALETIERNAKAQAQLIDDLLDIAQLMRGKLTLDIRPVELVPLIESAIETARPAAESKSIRLISALDPSAGSIFADYNRLQQVAWNLFSNAVKFTPEGGCVTVSLRLLDSHIEIQVSDTGSGIGPEILPYVFERFRQADSTITRSHRGLGLGLAIVRQLVELHGGTVQATSPGESQGATFTVVLPKVPTNMPDNLRINEPRQPMAERGLAVLPLDGLRLLVVDDEADAREVLTTVLEQSGAGVTAVSSVAAALEAIADTQAGRFDVLLSDIGMPGEDGYTLIRKVRALQPEQGGQIPAVALTAYIREQDRSQALSAGFQMHMPKPLNATELTEVVVSLAGRTARI